MGFIIVCGIGIVVKLLAVLLIRAFGLRETSFCVVRGMVLSCFFRFVVFWFGNPTSGKQDGWWYIGGQRIDGGVITVTHGWNIDSDPSQYFCNRLVCTSTKRNANITPLVCIRTIRTRTHANPCSSSLRPLYRQKTKM
jgi:hypothetical protein